MNVARRIGTFLIIIGAGLIAFFVLSDLALNASYGSLLIGTILLVGGISMVVSNPTPDTHPNPRFRTLKKIMNRDEKIEGKKK